MYKVFIYTYANEKSENLRMRQKVIEFTATFDGKDEFAKKCAQEFLNNFLSNYLGCCWGHISYIKYNSIQSFNKS